MPQTTTLIPPFAGVPMEEQVAKYLFDHRDVMLNGSYTRARLADHCQVPIRMVNEAVRIAVGLEPLRITICELERRHGYVVRMTGDPVVYGISTLTRRKAMRTEMLRWKRNYTALGAADRARAIDDMLVGLDQEIVDIEAEITAAIGP